MHISCAVEENVDRADGFGKLLDAKSVGHVENRGIDVRVPLVQIGKRVGIAVNCPNSSPFFCVGDRRSPADPLACAGDYGDLSRQPTSHVVSLLPATSESTAPRATFRSDRRLNLPIGSKGHMHLPLAPAQRDKQGVDWAVAVPVTSRPGGKKGKEVR